MSSKEQLRKDVVRDLRIRIFKATGYEMNIGFEGLSLELEVDRGYRIDHGGGEYGDERLEDYEVEELSQSYQQKHQSKIDKIRSILDKIYFSGEYPDSGIIEASVEWGYGEKGHCSIWICITWRA